MRFVTPHTPRAQLSWLTQEFGIKLVGHERFAEGLQSTPEAAGSVVPYLVRSRLPTTDGHIAAGGSCIHVTGIDFDLFRHSIQRGTPRKGLVTRRRLYNYTKVC